MERKREREREREKERKKEGGDLYRGENWMGGGFGFSSGPVAILDQFGQVPRLRVVFVLGTTIGIIHILELPGLFLSDYLNPFNLHFSQIHILHFLVILLDQKV